jgi:uncharacterized secreted protein with C-terminal beta-propeller domain
MFQPCIWGGSTVDRSSICFAMLYVGRYEVFFIPTYLRGNIYRLDVGAESCLNQM